MLLMCKARKVLDWFRYDLPQGIEQIIAWFPTIWKNRDWDHYYIYVVLRHKLHMTEQHIRNHGNHTRSEQDSDQIKKCVLILDRLIKDDYHDMAFKRHEEKWGEPKMETHPLEDNSECVGVDIVYDNVKTIEDQEKERKDFKSAFEHEEYLKNQDLDMLFKLMRKNIQGWWD